ncbi:LysR family transcriptional regulator substrate-binding protein [Actinomadura syzygii]|uniref:LysR family transcriptional regulator substrate-binding protein n=1 Tax=Actinomadura syzygii TaxID=1427538 RepID=A0A5D0TRV6_9ACTN|nr:LysR family transcriptional regulator substrate-binding protein [Actinomadura syzygii]
MRVRVREADFTDPSAGLQAGLVDVALTRLPFDDAGLVVRVLRTDPVGVVLRADDPLAGRPRLRSGELADRRWFRLPDGVDPLWRACWSGPAGSDGPVVRTVHECLQAVLWNGSVGLAPARPRPPRRPRLGRPGGHAAEPPRRRLAHRRREPPRPLVRADRRGRLPPRRLARQAHRACAPPAREDAVRGQGSGTTCGAMLESFSHVSSNSRSGVDAPTIPAPARSQARPSSL